MKTCPGCGFEFPPGDPYIIIGDGYDYRRVEIKDIKACLKCGARFASITNASEVVGIYEVQDDIDPVDYVHGLRDEA